MLSWFKSDPIKKLKKDYEVLLKAAMQAQRNGDIRAYSELTVEANKLHQQIQEAQAHKAS